MMNNAYPLVLAVTVIVAIVLMVAIRKPARLSTDGSSVTLGLTKLTMFLIFVVIILDTMNDVVPSRNTFTAPNTTSKIRSTSKSTKKKRVARRNHSKPAKKREVNKDKYWLLGFVFLICMGSYIARHPKIAEFWERVAAAWKGNPLPNQSDTMEDFMVTYLLQHPDAYHEEWFLRAMVAKRGGNPFEGMEKTAPANEPIFVDPGEGLEGYGEESS